MKRRLAKLYIVHARFEFGRWLAIRLFGRQYGSQVPPFIARANRPISVAPDKTARAPSLGLRR
jgi:hypothetical protein